MSDENTDRDRDRATEVAYVLGQWPAIRLADRDSSKPSAILTCIIDERRAARDWRARGWPRLADRIEDRASELENLLVNILEAAEARVAVTHVPGGAP